MMPQKATNVHHTPADGNRGDRRGVTTATSHTGASDWPSTNYTDIVYQGIPASAVFSFSMVEVQRGA